MDEIYFFIGLIPASTLIFHDDSSLTANQNRMLNKGLAIRLIFLAILVTILIIRIF